MVNSYVKCTRVMPYEHAVVFCGQHQLYVTYGWARSASQTTTLFLPSRWEEFQSMNTPRFLFGLACTPGVQLFAAGGVGGDREPTATVEMLNCSWEAREGKTASKWRYVAPLLAPRYKHGMCYFAEKLFVVGGKNDGTVECFALPSAGDEMGQWTGVRPLFRDIMLVGVLPFGEALLCVGKCVMDLQKAVLLRSK